AIKISNKNLPYVKLSDGLGAQISQTDFWIVQVKKSDPNLNFERAVIEPLSNSKVLMESMYEGRETEFGEFEKPDEESKAVLKESIFNVDQLLEISRARWEAKPQVVVPATDSTEAIVDTKSLDVLNIQLEASAKNFQ